MASKLITSFPANLATGRLPAVQAVFVMFDGRDGRPLAVIDGTEITKVMHFGRYMKAEMRTALDLGPPPDLDGPRCVDCGSPIAIQWDHRQPFAVCRCTEKGNIDARCRPDHKEKTNRDREAGLLGPDPRDPP